MSYVHLHATIHGIGITLVMRGTFYVVVCRFGGAYMHHDVILRNHHINAPLVVVSPRCREWAQGRFRRGVGGHESDGYRCMCRVASVRPVRGEWGLGVVVEPTCLVRCDARRVVVAADLCVLCVCRSVAPLSLVCIVVL